MAHIDIHVHLAGIGQGDHGCFISPLMTRTLVYRLLKRLLRVSTDDPSAATEDFARRLVALMAASKELDYACIFAMDGVYDGAGELVPAQSHLYVPNKWVFEVARRSPHLLPVISINPQRKDAMAELARWGPLAVAMKWLGPLQKFDPSNAAYEPFYDAMKELGLPLIAHSGCEHTFPRMAQRLGNPLLYESLARRGLPVIFSHCGTGSFLAPAHDYSAEFVSMLERHDNVYGDNSAFCTLVRRHQLRRFAADRYMGRIFHGSDWPIPNSAVYFLPELGFNRIRSLETDRHPLDRDVITKRAMGLPETVFTGAYELLASRIERWEQARQTLNREQGVE